MMMMTYKTLHWVVKCRAESVQYLWSSQCIKETFYSLLSYCASTSTSSSLQATLKVVIMNDDDDDDDISNIALGFFATV